jgi:hypothetical protein
MKEEIAAICSPGRGFAGEAGAALSGADSSNLQSDTAALPQWLTCNKKSSDGTQSSRPWTEC